jgi:hypothetical protein
MSGRGLSPSIPPSSSLVTNDCRYPEVAGLRILQLKDYLPSDAGSS